MTRPAGTGIIGRMTPMLRRLSRPVLLGAVCLGLLLTLAREWPDRDEEDYLFGQAVHNRQFDFVAWELEVLGAKALYSLAPPHSYLRQSNQKATVLGFIDQLREVQGLEAQIATVYTDPAVADPRAAATDLQGQLEQARRRLAALQPLAEGIVEEQIAAVLADEGLAAAGRTFPPVKLHFTALPAMLVVSPRDRIETIRSVALEHGLETPERVEIETAVDEALDVSSLVVNVGGLGAYPAMMLESSSLNWIAEVGAHEWTHHYLTLRPLGIRYDQDAQLRTMNETAANIVGKEVGAEVVRRYYPELAPPPPGPRAEPASEPDPPAFSFGGEMRITRVRVDALLDQGQIEEAEAYMEARRRFFWENGYHIRKLNQAYFAFHGSYADEPGAPGDDPVGPAVLELRERSGSLKEFLEALAPITSFAELEGMLAE